MDSNRYFFCFPRGGLSDVSNVIWFCFNYCKKYSRILVIDTRYLISFGDDIRKYFIFKDDPIIYTGDLNSIYDIFNNSYKTYFPLKLTTENIKNIKRDINLSYNSDYKIDNISLTIDLDKDYPHNIITYSNCRGCGNILNFFSMISHVSDIIMKPFIQRYEILPKDYISAHVRYSDRKSDINTFIEDNNEVFKNNKIFLATDSYHILQKFINIYGDENICSFSNLQHDKQNSETDKPLHFRKKDNIQEFIIDCVCDMFLLCYGKEYYYSNSNSGYSKNVSYIRDNIEELNRITRNNIGIEELYICKNIFDKLNFNMNYFFILFMFISVVIIMLIK